MVANDAKSFNSQIDSWVKETEERTLAVFKESVQRTVSMAQARIPVDTGYARASIKSSLQSMPPVDFRSKKDGVTVSYSYDETPLIATISNARLGQTIYIGWTASYVQALEDGHSNQAPSGFVGLAVAEWQHTVDQVTRELKARVGQSGSSD